MTDQPNFTPEPDGMNDDDLGNAMATHPAPGATVAPASVPRRKPLNVDHPHGDGTYGTHAGEPLDRLGAGGKYGE